MRKNLRGYQKDHKGNSGLRVVALRCSTPDKRMSARECDNFKMMSAIEIMEAPTIAHGATH